MSELPRPQAETVGNYELLGEIDRGGMGIVYKARERASGRLVALKMMLRDRADSQGDLRRFELEARATGELNHPGVVAIHSWGEHRGNPYFTMDYVPGVSLARKMEQGPMPLAQAVRYLTGISRAVAAAHELGIVHRDLKPSNVILDLSDQPRVLDFGLAKRQRSAEPLPETTEVYDALPVSDGPPAPGADTLGRHRTEVGAILGTPAYMAPEQVRAEHEQVGPAADVHALGALFFEMVTGQPPFLGESTYDTLMQVLRKEPPSLRGRRPDAPAELDAFCRQCLAKEAEERYPDAGAAADDLARRWRMCRALNRFRRLTWTATLVLVALHVVALIGGLWLADAEKVGEASAAWAPDSPVMQSAAGLLSGGLAGLALVVAPYLAELGLLVWLAGWVWHSERPWRVAAGWVLAAGAIALLSLIPGLSVWREGPLFLAGMAVVNALAAVGVATYRFVSPTQSDDPESPRRQADPYLARLLVSRVEAAAAGSETSTESGWADFELGKVLHRFDAGGGPHEVRWARQRSLDRSVLVWIDRSPGLEGQMAPGVMVRHAAVLVLYTVGSGPEGRYLATEAAMASPLPEAVQQRGLVPEEAVLLAGRLAEAVQAFHDQGACHGRLTPDWVLMRGELEPLLCPCGVPSQSPEERRADIRALGAMLRDWLPRPTALTGWGILGPLYRLTETACRGGFDRASDLADDLKGVMDEMRARWRQGWSLRLMGLLLLLGFLAPVAGSFLTDGRIGPGDVLVSLLPAAVLLGWIWGRGLGWRLRRRRRVAARSWRDGGTLGILLATAAFATTVGLLVGWSAAANNPGPAWPAVALLLGELAAAGLLGLGFAAVWTFAEGLVGSLRLA